MCGLNYLGRKQMTKVVYRNILITLLATSVFFNALIGGVSYQLKHKLELQTADFNITKQNLYQLEIAYNELNEKAQDMDTIQGVIYEAGKHFKVDPLLLTAIIKSESNFRPYPKHNLKHVVGIAGINVDAHKEILLYNPYSVKGNIYASAQVVSAYNKDNNMTLALTKYKGYSKLGKKQALEVIEDYKMIKGNNP